MKFLKRILNGRDTYYVHRNDDGEEVVSDGTGRVIADYEDLKAAQEEAKNQ